MSAQMTFGNKLRGDFIQRRRGGILLLSVLTPTLGAGSVVFGMLWDREAREQDRRAAATGNPVGLNSSIAEMGFAFGTVVLAIGAAAVWIVGFVRALKYGRLLKRLEPALKVSRPSPRIAAAQP